MFKLDLAEVKEKEPLPAPGPYVFGFAGQPVLEPSKDGTSYNVVFDLVPDGRSAEEAFRVWYSLKPGALASAEPTISFKKFLMKIVGIADPIISGDPGQALKVYARDGQELLLRHVKFASTVRHEKREGYETPNVRLDQIAGPA